MCPLRRVDALKDCGTYLSLKTNSAGFVGGCFSKHALGGCGKQFQRKIAGTPMLWVGDSKHCHRRHMTTLGISAET